MARHHNACCTTLLLRILIHGTCGFMEDMNIPDRLALEGRQA
jgi:hypothetical protein